MAREFQNGKKKSSNKSGLEWGKVQNLIEQAEGEKEKYMALKKEEKNNRNTNNLKKESMALNRGMEGSYASPSTSGAFFAACRSQGLAYNDPPDTYAGESSLPGESAGVQSESSSSASFSDQFSSPLLMKDMGKQARSTESGKKRSVDSVDDLDKDTKRVAKFAKERQAARDLVRANEMKVQMEQRAADRAERVKENESLKTAVMEAVNAKTNALDTRLGGIEGLLTQLIAVQAANQAGSQK